MPSPQNREEALFQAAVQLTGAERAAFLNGSCLGDNALRQRLEALLAAHELPDPSLATQAEAARPTIKLDLADAPDEAVGQTLGRYKLLERVGEGGCGVVYVAEQTEPVRRRVALKVIKLGMDTKQVVARFEAERQALSMMDHPNIAKVLDAGTTELGRPFFVMELVRGIRITDYCDQNNLATNERLDLFIKVCQAIQHSHQKGIIHRDIKPSNILVTLHDGVPVPKVIDFGIAKATEGRLTDMTVYTQLHQFIGTPAYMSPEQAEMSGLDIDTRSDIYSLGVLLYELLVGSTPFDATELMASGIDAMRKTIREREPARPSTKLATLQGEEQTMTAKRRSVEISKLAHLVKGDLDWIVMKCLEKDRTRRYETANGLGADLKRHLTNEPVLARPPSAAYKFQKAFRRNKLVFSAGVAVILALVAGLSLAAIGWRETRIERDKAIQAKAGEEGQRRAAQASEQKARTAEAGQIRLREQAETREAETRHLFYVADMKLTQQAWEQNNLSWLRQLLKETQTFPERGFEWYYWQRQTHLALKTLTGHLDRVSSVAFSPDGQRIVTGSFDHTAKVWEAASGREVLTLKGHKSEIESVAFSPDGRQIVTGSDDHTAKVWEAASGKEVATLKGHKSEIESVAFSPDGRRIVTGSDDQTAKVWEATSGKELVTLRGHTKVVRSAAFSPDGDRIVTSGEDDTAKVWDSATGKVLITITGHNRVIPSAAFSPDGKRIVTGCWDSTAKVWDASTGKELLALKGHNGGIPSVSFSRDGQRILTGGYDQTARVWDSATGKELLALKGHNGMIFSAAFSPDGQRIVTGSFDHTAKVWEAASGLPAGMKVRNLVSFEEQGVRILAVAFSLDGQRIVTGGDDHTAKVWDVASGKELVTFKGHGAPILSVAFSSNGEQIVTGSDDHTAKVWNAASGKELVTLKGHDDWIRSVAFSPDGQRIVTGSYDHTAKVWDVASGKELVTLKGHDDRIQSLAFSPDGQRIVTGSYDHTAKVWDVASGKELVTFKGHGAPILSVAFSSNGEQIVTGSDDHTAKVWNAASGKELVTLQGHSAFLTSVAFSPDGRRIVTGSGDHTAEVWEAATGRELLTLSEHTDMILSVAFSPDGRRIFTGSWDQTARVWEAARPEQVAAWQKDDRAAAQHLTALHREQIAEEERQRITHSRDSVKQWLVLGPIPVAKNQSGTEALDIEQITGEAQLRPKAGETRSVGVGELKWLAATIEDYVIDFQAIFGRETTQNVAYAVCYIQSDAAQRGLQMMVGSDDEAKVYLNGKQVYEAPVPHGTVAVEDTVLGIALNAGLNVIVFKVVNEERQWKGSIRFADVQGNPVKGIKVTLDPRREGLAVNPSREEALFVLAPTKIAAERAAFLDRECVG